MPFFWRTAEAVPVGFLNDQIVNARNAPTHETVQLEFPELDAKGPIPLPRIVVPLVFKLNGHAVLPKSPQRLLQRIIKFPIPFPFQKLLYLLPPLQEFRAIAPLTIFRVCKHNPLWIPCIPQILGDLYFSFGSFFRKWRYYD